MSLSNNYWCRWFAGAFAFGVAIVALAKTSQNFKDLKLESVSGKFVFEGISAWLVVGLMMGITAGILGLGVGGTKKWLSN